jgi:hypothetical protein
MRNGRTSAFNRPTTDRGDKNTAVYIFFFHDRVDNLHDFDPDWYGSLRVVNGKLSHTGVPNSRGTVDQEFVERNGTTQDA